MPLLQTTCNSFSSLGPAQKQSWENCFCRPHWGRWCLSVGLLSSPLPILLLLHLLPLPTFASPCSSWLALCCHGFQLHSTERRHTHTYPKYHTHTHASLLHLFLMCKIAILLASASSLASLLVFFPCLCKKSWPCNLVLIAIVNAFRYIFVKKIQQWKLSNGICRICLNCETKKFLITSLASLAASTTNKLTRLSKY